MKILPQKFNKFNWSIFVPNYGMGYSSIDWVHWCIAVYFLYFLSECGEIYKTSTYHNKPKAFSLVEQDDMNAVISEHQPPTPMFSKENNVGLQYTLIKENEDVHMHQIRNHWNGFCQPPMFIRIISSWNDTIFVRFQIYFLYAGVASWYNFCKPLILNLPTIFPCLMELW